MKLYFWCTKINKKQTMGYSRKIHTFMTEGMLENLRGGGGLMALEIQRGGGL